MSSLSADTNGHRRRGSSIGNVNVGDTSSPSLSTMKTTASQRLKLTRRIEALSHESTTDFDIAKKMYVGFKELSYRHTWIKPMLTLLVILGVFAGTKKGSQAHEFLASYIMLAYPIEGTDQYGKGVDDFKFVAFYAIVFTFLREFLMCVVMRPLASVLGVKKRSKVKRFMEQAYAMFYYGISGPFGLWVMSRTPLWFFETTPFYTNYPHKTHDFYFKVYYLIQASFWVQQSVVLILRLEKPRKDYYELVFHHIVTIALIWLSYRFHFTWIGLEIYVTMDVSDFFLAITKVFNYMESVLDGPALITLICVWTYLRHYINLKILWSVLTEFKTVGDWELNWDTQQYKCWISQPIVFGLLFALQVLNAYWLFLIIRIVYRFVVGGGVEDERSDDEDDDVQQEAKVEKKQQ